MDTEATLAELRIEPLTGGSYAPVTPTEAKQLEDALGAPLPEDYKAFILKYGASAFAHPVVVRSLRPPPKHISGSRLLDFSSFYGSDSEGDGLSSYLVNLEGRMPATLLPIAGDRAGNSFCLGITGPDRNKVYLWDAENEPAAEDFVAKGLAVPDDLWYRNLTQVATSFTDLISRLEPEALAD